MESEWTQQRRLGGVGRKTESVVGSPSECVSAVEWTCIYYSSSLPAIKPVMSWFDSLGKSQRTAVMYQ